MSSRGLANLSQVRSQTYREPDRKTIARDSQTDRIDTVTATATVFCSYSWCPSTAGLYSPTCGQSSMHRPGGRCAQAREAPQRCMRFEMKKKERR